MRETINKSLGNRGTILCFESESAWFASERCSQATALNTCSSSGDPDPSVGRDEDEWSIIEDDIDLSNDGSFEIGRSLSNNR